MTRLAVAGCMTLAALSAVAVLDVGAPTAEAAPSVIRFAGTFQWAGWPANVTISDGGRIASSWSGAERSKGSISGRVGAEGRYSFTMSVTYWDGEAGGGHTYQTGAWVTRRYEYAGNMAPDVDGNLVLTDDSGGSRVWLRQ